MTWLADGVAAYVGRVEAVALFTNPIESMSNTAVASGYAPSFRVARDYKEFLSQRPPPGSRFHP